tara:strand:+ start:329 stop:868 length:540 start_codon:yes stop_codon:yes gene_type:complete
MSEITIEDLEYTKEFEELSKLLEKVFRRSLSYTKVKNISLDDVGKNFSIYPEIKITFETHDGWEGGNPKEGKKTSFYTERSGAFMIFVPMDFKIGDNFKQHLYPENFAVDVWRKKSERLYQLSYEFNKDDNDYIINGIRAAGVTIYLGDLALAQGLINYDEELKNVKEDANKLKQLLSK